MKYEYRLVNAGSDPQSAGKILSDYGRQGWRVIEVSSNTPLAVLMERTY